MNATAFKTITDNLAYGKAVKLDDNWYAIIEGAIYWVYIDNEVQGYRYYPTELTVTQLLDLSDKWKGGQDAIRSLPLQLILDDSREWDYTKAPRGDCPKCFTYTTADSLVKNGQFGHCPHCDRHIFTATSLFISLTSDQIDLYEQVLLESYGAVQGPAIFDRFLASREEYIEREKEDRNKRKEIEETEAQITKKQQIELALKQEEEKIEALLANADSKPKRKVRVSLPQD